MEGLFLNNSRTIMDQRSPSPPKNLANTAYLAAILLTLTGCALNPATLGQATPPATPELLRTSSLEKILFSDDFNSNVNGWQLDEVQSHWLDWKINEGKLQVHRTRTNVPFSGLLHFYLPIPNQTFTDFQISVVGQAAANTASLGYGIFVDRPNATARYYFELDTDGMYSIAQESQPPGQPHYLQEPASLSTIKPTEPNQLTLKAVGPTLTFLINGIEITAAQNIPLGPGPVGLFIELVPGSDDQAYVEFDQVLVQASEA